MSDDHNFTVLSDADGSLGVSVTHNGLPAGYATWRYFYADPSLVPTHDGSDSVNVACGSCKVSLRYDGAA